MCRITGEIQTDVVDLQLAIYDDEQLFWEYIMTDDDCDCDCKVSRAHTKFVYNVTQTTDLSIPFLFSFDIHEHLRPRFWYVALARCVPGGDEYEPSFTQITEANFRKYYFTSWYRIHMTQANGSELPVQQQGMPVIYALMAVLSGIAALVQTIAARGLRKSESFHPIMKLLTMVVFFFSLSNVLLFLHFYAYMFNGVGVPLFSYSAKMMQVFVRVGTILLAMLVAKGWTINSVALEGQEKLSCLMISILGLYLSMAMWYLIWLDPASTLYIYDSWPGIGICVLLLGALIWFVNTILETRSYEEASAKRRFFLQIACLFSVYIVALPVIVLLASFLSPWVREKTVAAISTSVELCVYTALIYLLWPSRAPRYFERLYSVSSPSEKATLREQHLPTEEL
uniref:GPR180/TMEM145 transmembrane domain-containing protein n=1 Tax=Globisporangium ultimum (strain ATCC 200006 / CBS 805.95 / DAOM BR144) TaxID=431595 RepID=K3W6S0_GLOUD